MRRTVITILMIFAVLVVGLFVINYMPPTNSMLDNSVSADNDFIKSIVDQMFPESKYTIEGNMVYFSTQIPATYQTLYLEQIRYGKFMEDKSEYLAVFRAPDDVTVHAGGLYYTIAAVFDTETNKIKSQNNDFTSDEGEISILRGNGRDLILFLGSTTYQGYTTATGGVYNLIQESWEQTWPEGSDFWNNRYAVFGNDRLILYKKVIEPVDYETTIPPYHFEPDIELVWDSMTETFKEPVR